MRIFFDIETTGLDWTKDQVVCIGWWADCLEMPQVLYASSPKEEGLIISRFMDIIAYATINPKKDKNTEELSEEKVTRTLVTFNGHTFDLPFLRGRASLLGVPWSRQDLGVRKYYSYDREKHEDVYQYLQVMNTGPKRPSGENKLGWWCDLYGVPVNGVDEIDGKEVPNLYTTSQGLTMPAGKKKMKEVQTKISEHCIADILRLVKLHAVTYKGILQYNPDRRRSEY